MLTLGLMEGVFLAAAQLLTLVGAIDGGTPMHRLLGPPAAAVLGLVGWAVYDSHTARFADTVGLLVVAALCFGLPLLIMRWGWREMTGRTAKSAEILHVPVGPPTQASTTERGVA